MSEPHDTPVISRDQREKLVELVKKDPKFRELLKKDWPAAMKQAGVDAKELKGRVLKESQFQPFKGGSTKASIEIIIEIFAAAREERIRVEDIVVFNERAIT